MNPTFILSRPRSRSTWLAHFLGGIHEPSIFMSAEEFPKYKILVDTNLVLYYEDIKRFFPESKIFILYRKEEEVKKSLSKFGLPYIEEVGDRIEVLSKSYPTIWFDRLNDREYLKQIYKEIVGEECSEEHLRKYHTVKIETKLPVFVEEVKRWQLSRQ